MLKAPLDRSIGFFVQQYLVHIATMSHRLVALSVIHHGSALAAVCQLVTADAHDEIDVREHVLCLQVTQT